MSTKTRSRSVKGTLATVGILALAWIAHSAGLIELPIGREQAPGPAQAGGGDRSVVARTAIAEAFAAGRSDVLVEAAGVVERVLPDDNEGSRHQRFILVLDDGTTILVAHNIDLASRVPLETGDRVEFKGEYEWNEKGGVVHWTHHDPGGRREGGWLRHEGKTYE